MAEGGLSSFVKTLVLKHSEDRLWELWTRKEIDKNWNDFKEEFLPKHEDIKTPHMEYNDIVQSSLDILERGT